MSANRWQSLPPHPNLLTHYIGRLGISTDWSVIDLADITEVETPRPVKALFFLFPCTTNYVRHCAEEHERMLNLPASEEFPPGDVLHMRQKSHSTCATVALIHSIANSTDVEIPDGALKNFVFLAKLLTPAESGEALEQDLELLAIHQGLVQDYNVNDNVDKEPIEIQHLIALVNKNGTLYELDGRKSFPISHGSTTEESFLNDAATVCKQLMERDRDHEYRVSLMGLAAATEGQSKI